MSLKFKGDKPKKKKRSHRELEDADDKGEGSSTGLSVKARYGKDVEGWVLLLGPDDIVGPTFLTTKSSVSPSGAAMSLCSNPINQKVYPFLLPDSMTVQEAEPTQVDSIWRCARVPESEEKITLKSAQDRYLSCNHLGEIKAFTEARGPEEEFILVSKQDTHGKGAFAIQSAAYGKFVTVDEIAGGKLEFRGDADTADDDEVWYIKMQADFLGKMEEEYRKRQRKPTADDGLTIIGDIKGAEQAKISKYQAHGQGKVVTSNASKADLRQAQKEGRLAEEMLDRRMKLKSDRYC